MFSFISLHLPRFTRFFLPDNFYLQPEIKFSILILNVIFLSSNVSCNLIEKLKTQQAFNYGNNSTFAIPNCKVHVTMKIISNR